MSKERMAASNSVELHDCGIVYPDGDAYLLCVMTKGRDIEKLKMAIAHVSEMVYADAAR